MISNSENNSILFLGTGAADWPAPPYGTAMKETQNGAMRGYSSVIIDGQLLIDCGATVPDAIDHFGVDINRITDILLTHTHPDHFDIDAIRWLISIRNGKNSINLRAHPSALSKLPEIQGICQCATEVGETFNLPSMTATSLAANHDVADETALHFLLQKDGVSILYATDGAWFLKNTWAYLMKTVLDVIIWDTTCGETKGDWRIFEHNSIDMINIMYQTLATQGVISPRTKIFLTHMSKSLCAPHDDMTKRLASQGLIPAYDGLTVSISDNDLQKF